MNFLGPYFNLFSFLTSDHSDFTVHTLVLDDHVKTVKQKQCVSCLNGPLVVKHAKTVVRQELTGGKISVVVFINPSARSKCSSYLNSATYTFYV